jgi:hypothetical protein
MLQIYFNTTVLLLASLFTAAIIHFSSNGITTEWARLKKSAIISCGTNGIPMSNDSLPESNNNSCTHQFACFEKERKRRRLTIKQV